MPHQQTIKFYRGVEADIPVLAEGEPGFTTDTHKFFIGDGAANHEIGGGSGTGDVVGPDSAVNNGVALFDGVTGKLIKDGGVLGTAAYSDDGDFDPAGSAAAAQAASQPLDATLTAISGAGTTGTGAVVLASALSGGGGSGDVTAASAFGTDNRVIRSDGTGKGVQASTVTIEDTGDMTVTGTIAASNLSGTNTGDQTITLTGDVTGSGTGAFAATISNDAVTNAKAADMPANSIKMNVTGSTASPDDVTLAGLTAATPVSGDQIIGMLSTGEIRKYNFADFGGGGATWTVSAKSADFTAGVVTNTAYHCDVSGANCTATLPAASGNAGLVLEFKLTTAPAGNTLTIDGNSSETIDGATTLVLYALNESVTLLCDGSNWKILIDGRIPHRCLLTNNAAQTISNSTLTIVTFNTETFDDYGMHSTSSNTGRINILRTGQYWLFAFTIFASATTGVRQIYYKVNGSYTQAAIFPIAAGNETQVYFPALVNLTAGDYVEMVVWHSNGGNLNINNLGNANGLIFGVSEVR